MSPLTVAPDDTPDITITVTDDGAEYRARFVGVALKELLITATSGTQITAETMRRAPLGELRANALKAISKLAQRMTDEDRALMVVDQHQGDRVALLEDAVRALVIARHFVPDRPAELVAEINGVSRSTVYRWQKEAADNMMATPEALQVAAAAWKQTRRLMRRKAGQQ